MFLTSINIRTSNAIRKVWLDLRILAFLLLNSKM